jgi:hypothetical protein
MRAVVAKIGPARASPFLHVGIVAAGNDGLNDVSVNNGLRLVDSEEVYFERVGNLGRLFVDAAVNGGYYILLPLHTIYQRGI